MDNCDNICQENQKLEIDGPNPFENPIILDMMFKHLPYNELKNMRFVHSQWNQSSIRQIPKMEQQQPIIFDKCDDFDKKFEQLINRQKEQEIFFPGGSSIFVKFSIDINLIEDPIMDKILEKFSPKYLKIFGEYEYEETKVDSIPLQNKLIEILKKISHNIQEIVFEFKSNFCYLIKPDQIRSLSTIGFPNLRKISLEISFQDYFLENFFYPLIGQRSPKMRDLTILTTDSFCPIDFKSKLKEGFLQTGLMSKLKILSLCEKNFVLDVFTEFGENGDLKLLKFSYGDDSYIQRNFHQSFVRFCASQNSSLEILKILRIESNKMLRTDLEDRRIGKAHEGQVHVQGQDQIQDPLISPDPKINEQIRILRQSSKFEYHDINFTNWEQFKEYLDVNPSPPIKFSIKPVQFPVMENLKKLIITNFTGWSTYFETYKFSSTFSKLQEFNSHDMNEFIHENIGTCGDSLSSVTFLNPKENEVDFRKFGKIFPNLKNLELYSDSIPSSKSYVQNIPFWKKLENLVVHVTLGYILNINYRLIREVKCLNLDVRNVSNSLNEKHYEDYLDSIVTNLKIHDREGTFDDKKSYTKKELYKLFFQICLRNFGQPALFSITGNKISEDFKRDLRETFHNCSFIDSNPIPCLNWSRTCFIQEFAGQFLASLREVNIYLKTAKQILE